MNDLSLLRIGIGYDCHMFVPNNYLILGGVRIPFNKGLLGHSDADVLIHAIIDSLIGAAGLGDIGNHFPDNDKKYKEISSRVLLENIRAKIHDLGYEINNIDTTLILEFPKLSNYIPQMKKKISESLLISSNKINIKAKTNEKLGWIGREEGIAAQSVALIVLKK
tara:strand:+ start:2173 stop:2667 length:495 start_codon:yes stop_codon:yes gene_type:complete